MVACGAGAAGWVGTAAYGGRSCLSWWLSAWWYGSSSERASDRVRRSAERHESFRIARMTPSEILAWRGGVLDTPSERILDTVRTPHRAIPQLSSGRPPMGRLWSFTSCV